MCAKLYVIINYKARWVYWKFNFFSVLYVYRLIITELNLKDSGVYSAKIGDLETKAELKVQGQLINFQLVC